MAFSEKKWIYSDSPLSPVLCCKPFGDLYNVWEQLIQDINEIIEIIETSGLSDTCLNDAGLPFTFWGGNCFETNESIILNALGVEEGIVDKIIDVSEGDSEPSLVGGCLNLFLKVGQCGYVKFGDYVANSEPSTVIIDGYITIVDKAGKLRKLAVIDDSDESQPTSGDL